METDKIHDPAGWAKDKDILESIKTEKLYYCDKITKINHYDMSQERILILTDKALYNMKKKSLKRKLLFEHIKGITLSKLTYEFVVHGMENEYDYDYISQDRSLVIFYIAVNYQLITGKPLKICSVEDKNLKHYVTSKKEKEKETSFTKMNTSYLIDTFEFLKEVADSEGIILTNELLSSRGSIHSTLKINNEIGKNKANEDVKNKNRTQTLLSKHKTVKQVTLEDFVVVKVLGRGSFGKVCLVEYKPTHEYYAMKSLKKDVLLDQDQVQSTLLEKKILESLDFPFLVGMIFCFQTEERIYFVMSFVRGGELFQHLRNFKHFDENQVRFYAAIIGMALDYLHVKGIVYRDIKPENILMDEDGYLKLVDFGMAKILHGDEKATSFCGTPEYLPPEIITGEGHNQSADWWSYGVLIYEMLCGIPPFYCENTEKMYELITTAEIRFPKKIQFSDNAKDLIKKLLIKNQNERLGCKNGFAQIKVHPFFQGFDFDALLNKKLPAPFKPTLSGQLDVANFDAEFTNEEIGNSMIPEKNLEYIKRNQGQFDDFNS